MNRSKAFRTLVIGASLALAAAGAMAQQVVAQVMSVERESQSAPRQQWVCQQANYDQGYSQQGYQNQGNDQGGYPEQNYQQVDSYGNVIGGVAGAAVGGIAGNQIGKGNGRKAAAILGAVMGAYAGSQVGQGQNRGNQAAQGQNCGYVQTMERVPTGGFRAIVDVDGAYYEWRSNRPVSPGDLIQVDARYLRRAM